MSNNYIRKNDLINLLEAIEGNPVVILQKDAEGNGYSPLRCVDGENLVYQPQETWFGDVKYKELTPELIEKGYEEADAADPDTPSEDCIVLVPIN